jgi:hypothetical protein
MLDAPEGDSLPTRRSVSERAEQRERMRRIGRDRYSSLLHTLHAGQELPWQPKPEVHRLAWHPIAWKLLRAAIVVVLLWIAVTTGLALWRDFRVDVWAGPDTSVTSGQRLDDCPLLRQVQVDGIFPNWIRYDGRLYLLTDLIRPMGFEPDADFPPTGYSKEGMTLFRIANTPDGRDGRIVVVKLDASAVGRVFRLAPDCT